MPSLHHARVAAILSPYQLVINRGSLGGMNLGDRVVIFTLGAVIIDPVNGNNLGQLEVVRGVGEVVHVQEHMSTVESRTSSAVEVKRGALQELARLAYPTTGVHTSASVSPFLEPEVGDFVRKVEK